MTCQDCLALQKENTMLQQENTELKRRLAAYQKPPHTTIQTQIPHPQTSNP